MASLTLRMFVITQTAELLLTRSLSPIFREKQTIVMSSNSDRPPMNIFLVRQLPQRVPV